MSFEKGINVLVVDDHPLVALALEVVFKKNFGSEVVVDYVLTSKDAIIKHKNYKYDLIVLDVFIPNTDIQNLLFSLKRIRPEIKVLIYSSASENIYGLSYIKQGAMGYVNKGACNEQLVRAVTTILSGKKYISEDLTDSLINEKNKINLHANPFFNLSKREVEVAKLIGKGLGVTEISKVLNLHTSTVGTQKNRIFQKLKISNSIEFFKLAEYHNFLDTNYNGYNE